MLVESNVRSLFDVVFGGPYEELGVRRRIWTASRSTPSHARDAPLMTNVRIDGIVEPLESVVPPSPFTAEPSVYWHVRLIARHVMRGMNLGINTASPEVWNPALVLSSTTNFWIVEEDGTRVLVDLEDFKRSAKKPTKDEEDEEDEQDDGDEREEDNAVVVARLEDVSNHRCVNDEDEHLNAFLRDHDIVPIEEMGRSGDYHFLEARIVPGQRVLVWGCIAELPSRIAAGYRDAATTIRRLTGTPTDPLIIVGLPSP